MTAHRTEKVADVIRQVLARLLLTEIRDPRVGFVTITDIRVSPDLGHARVFVTRIGTPEEKAGCIEALNHASPFFRRAVAKETRLRHVPELRFLEDASVDTGFRVDRLLEEIREPRSDDGEGTPPTQEGA